jgi:hypothetical protein
MSDAKTQAAVSLAMLPSNETIHKQAELAFTDTNTADSKRSTAEQRMAYVVQCTISNMLANGNKQVSLHLAYTNAEHKKTILAKMVHEYAGKMPNHKGIPVPQYAKEIDAWRTKSNLVKRGAWIAIVLASKNVMYTAFNVSKGVYSVPSELLLPADCTPIARLAKEQRLPLDRSPIAYMTKTQIVATTQASVKHMLDCVVPKTEGTKGAEKKDSEPGKETKAEKQAILAKATVTDIANGISLATLITAAHQLMVKDMGTSLMRHCDGPQMWNLLSDMMRKYDEFKAGPDWMTPRDMKDADERIVPESKAKKTKAA